MRRCRTGFCVRRARLTNWRFSCPDSVTPSTCRSSTTPRISCWSGVGMSCGSSMPTTRAPNSRPCQSRNGINGCWRIRRLPGAPVSASERYERVVLIGKSLGTLAMGHLLTMADPPPNVGAVWLTPLLSNERLRQQISAVRRTLPVRHRHGRSALRPGRAGADAGGDDRRSRRRQKRGPRYGYSGRSYRLGPRPRARSRSPRPVPLTPAGDGPQ